MPSPGGGSFDPVTGLADRAAFKTALKREVSWAATAGGPFSLVLLELHRLRPIDDERALGAGLKAIFTAPAIACRVGSSEFAAVAPGSTRSRAIVLAKRAGEGLAEWAPNVRQSFGTAEWQKGDNASTLFDRALEDLLARQGRALRGGPPGSSQPPDSAGVREPRRPRPPAGTGYVSLPLDPAA